MATLVKRAILSFVDRLGYTILKKPDREALERELLAARTEIAANDYPRLKAERDFYSNQMVELQTHNRVLTEAATQHALRAQELERELLAAGTQNALRVQELEQELLAVGTQNALRVQELEQEILAARTEIAANDYPRLKAERDFYSNQMVELQTHNRVLTETATQHALRAQELERELLAARTEIAANDYPRLKAERDFYSSQMAEFERQLSKQSTGFVAKIEQLSKQSALDRPLAFIAAPKTSSSALSVGLCEVLPSTAHIHGWDHGFFGAFRQFETMPPGLRQEIYETLPPANGIDFVFGQIGYSTVIQGRPTARLMTVLREPRSRILSLWMYWRSFSDEDYAVAGAWGRVQRLTRQPLAEFINHPEAACLTDNVYVRRLLWPHPLIPDDGFIDSASDERLTSEAAARLKVFDFADVIENPRLEDNVRAFLARPFVYRRVNETPPMP